jgi:hypothetical protein
MFHCVWLGVFIHFKFSFFFAFAVTTAHLKTGNGTVLGGTRGLKNSFWQMGRFAATLAPRHFFCDECAQVVRGYMNYAGEYRAGLMHGHGQMCWPDGSMCVSLICRASSAFVVMYCRQLRW